MNENADKNLDNLSREVMGKSAIESPSFDFTNTVMSQINSLNTSRVTVYEPLISKWVWGVIAAVFAGVVWFSRSGTSKEKSRWFSELDVDFEIANPLTQIELSQTVIYSIVLFAAMICIQIPVLKHYFNRRFEV